MRPLLEGRKLRVFDFDDTLAKSDALIYLTKADGTEIELDPGEYAVYKEEPGDEFDFRDFNKITIHFNPFISSKVSISETAVIGEGTVIQPNTFVGNNVTIGKNCLIHPNVTIYDGTIIGDNVTIHANTVLGADAFYYN